jgi:tetratricopeptide (TPR) repeat protein
VTTDAVVGGDGGRADTEQERWSLNDQRDFLLRSIDDAERELLAGDLSKEDYDVLLLRDQTRLAEVEAELAALGPAPEDGTDAVVSGGAAAETGSELDAFSSPRRRLSPWRRVGVVAACLLIITGLVILVDHAVSPSLPGQPISGSITESKVQLIEQQLSAANELNNNGQAVQALQLYDKVLSEDPTDPNALAASGWLEWNYGHEAKINAITKVGRQQEKKAIKLAPAYYAGHLFLGLIILNQDNNPTGAIAEFTKFLADSPPQAQVVTVAALVAAGYKQANVPLPPALAKALATEEASASTTTTTSTP